MSSIRDKHYYQAMSDEEFIMAASWPPEAYTPQELAYITTEIERRKIELGVRGTKPNLEPEEGEHFFYSAGYPVAFL